MNNDDHEAGLPDGLDLRALSAWVDDELPPAERAALEAKLEQHPQAAARVAAWRAQKAALRVLCGVPLQGEYGDRGERSDRTEHGERNVHGDRNDRERHEYGDRADATPEPTFIVVRRAAPWWQRVGIAACWLVAGAGIALALGPLAPRLTGGAWGGLGSQPPSFAERADVAYAVYTPERRHPVEVAASDEEHLINWLSKRLNRPLSVPSLQEYGYSLVGGRLLPGEAGPAAQFMYENAGGARLTLYVTGTARDETAFRLFRDGNRRTFYWISDGMGYALSGPIAEGKLRSIAVDVCSALGGKPETWQ
ncbi:anti-sigma factor [Paraburkholderia bryophila]|jgi:anti-sigma factor RsiW|uniref:Anti-sigma factor RsiW n=1 Tax=Paraburkholderia bryophila TaxID=420952 RepID=A0A329BQJ1_9BURK|nr:anti-sigma factor [Paraburkholderia bryophila]RAS24242.1 anti-sigma factor RsiW [Paraburkholderia bryophila]